jgi:hypothetical protein
VLRTIGTRRDKWNSCFALSLSSTRLRHLSLSCTLKQNPHKHTPVEPTSLSYHNSCCICGQCHVVTNHEEKKRQIGDHALPQRGFGLCTPEGAEGGWATPGNTGRGRQRERTQAPVHQTSSKHSSKEIEPSVCHVIQAYWRAACAQRQQSRQRCRDVAPGTVATSYT